GLRSQAVLCAGSWFWVMTLALGAVFLFSVGIADGAGLSWTAPAAIDNQPTPHVAALNAVACASTSLCVAVDNGGKVATSTNPTGGASAWSLASVDGTNVLQSVSCPTTSLC